MVMKNRFNPGCRIRFIFAMCTGRGMAKSSHHAEIESFNGTMPRGNSAGILGTSMISFVKGKTAYCNLTLSLSKRETWLRSSSWVGRER
jgi:hypothetical protein